MPLEQKVVLNENPFPPQSLLLSRICRMNLSPTDIVSALNNDDLQIRGFAAILNPSLSLNLNDARSYGYSPHQQGTAVARFVWYLPLEAQILFDQDMTIRSNPSGIPIDETPNLFRYRPKQVGLSHISNLLTPVEIISCNLNTRQKGQTLRDFLVVFYGQQPTDLQIIYKGAQIPECQIFPPINCY